MEFEKEKNTGTTLYPPPLKPFQQQPTQTSIPILKNYSQETGAVASIALLLVGLIGFVVDNLFGAHLNTPHNIIHIAAGVVGLWCAFEGLRPAKVFGYLAGALFTFIGISGFFWGTPGISTLGHFSQDPYMWKLLPGNFEWGVADHIIHLTFGTLILTGAMVTLRYTKRI